MADYPRSFRRRWKGFLRACRDDDRYALDSNPEQYAREAAGNVVLAELYFRPVNRLREHHLSERYGRHHAPPPEEWDSVRDSQYRAEAQLARAYFRARRLQSTAATKSGHLREEVEAAVEDLRRALERYSSHMEKYQENSFGTTASFDHALRAAKTIREATGRGESGMAETPEANSL